MKKILFLLILLFIILTVFVCFCPILNQWDKNVIVLVQEKLKDVPTWIPMLLDCKLYSISIIIPILIGIVYFFRQYLFIDVLLFAVSPVVPFLFNHIFKELIQRPRPPYELQMVHPDSFSYVSSHTLISFCLWGLVIFYLKKYCQNRILKSLGIIFAILWIFAIGLSRIWLGVHYPSDVIGAYIVGSIILILHIKIIKILGGKYQE